MYSHFYSKKNFVFFSAAAGLFHFYRGRPQHDLVYISCLLGTNSNAAHTGDTFFLVHLRRVLRRYGTHRAFCRTDPAFGAAFSGFRLQRNAAVISIGFVWMFIHATLLILVAKLIKAPYFFLAVGSQANVGGAASAPIVASAFHPSLATVGVLLAVVGYAVGTVGAIICTILMEISCS